MPQDRKFRTMGQEKHNVARENESAGGGRSNPATRWNADYLESMYRRWCKEPTSVNISWQQFFQGFDLGLGRSDSECGPIPAEDQSRMASLIYAYRNSGHRIARVNPLGGDPDPHPDLAIEEFGFTEADLDRTFDTGHLHMPQRSTLREILDFLQETYCSHIGVEYLHIQETAIRRWLQGEMEPVRNRPDFSRQRKLEILENLIDAEVFERFIHNRYPGQKRFSLEGAETLIPAMKALVELAPELGIQEIVLGMAHRGRLNVLANILNKSYTDIFNEFEGGYIPDSVGGSGDVKYHLGFCSDITTKAGNSLHISLTPNPSHLEAVNPVVEGRARARQRQLGDTEHRKTVLPLLIHGDAAFSGQGLVAETLNLSQLKGYHTGGTVHIIINNQIGFTTLPGESRSSIYSTDVAKMIEAPIFHCNGDDPEAMVHVVELALKFRQAFGRDVVVDMLCYRRLGHNESDEPSFTQPVQYRKIKEQVPVRKKYTAHLNQQGDLKAQEEEAIAEKIRLRLQNAFEIIREEHPPPKASSASGPCPGNIGEYSEAQVDTTVSGELLLEIATGITTVPEEFHLHPKLARLVKRRHETVVAGGPLDWGLAESLAFGSLVLEGTPIRLSGQDSARGTFSHRHSVWVDTRTLDTHTPINHIRPEDQAHFCVYNSSLSEASVLGFDYGYSLSEPDMLILWEAQFGDFANGAQVIIDQFLVGSQAKWGQTSGLVILLPHGYEGQGPEHSNAYLERYLMACAEENIQICNLTTPANYFHVLRRQVKRSFVRPLILMAPKSILRHKEAVSTIEDLTEGSFLEVMEDEEYRAAPGRTRRVVLCTGKVYYDLIQKRRDLDVGDVAIVRVEQLYPFPGNKICEAVHRFSGAGELVWLQEESKNRGAWSFLAPRLSELFPEYRLRYVGRNASASPATGSLKTHLREQNEILETALTGDLNRPVQVNAELVEKDGSFHDR